MCSEDTVVCSNTLTLNLTEVFSGIDHPQVRHVLSWAVKGLREAYNYKKYQNLG